MISRNYFYYGIKIRLNIGDIELCNKVITMLSLLELSICVV